MMHWNSLYLLHLHFEQMLVIVEMFPFDGEIIHILDQRLAGQSRAIAHAYATSPGLAWSAYFSFSLFGRQRLR